MQVKLIPDPVLRTRARRVQYADDLPHLVKAMYSTLLESGGVGLAANQVGVPLRVCLVTLEDGRVITLVNPEIHSERWRDAVGELEGCLSIPGAQVMVSRPSRIRVSAWGGEVVLKGRNARVVCHEVDHLNGVLITDKGVGAPP